MDLDHLQAHFLGGLTNFKGARIEDPVTIHSPFCFYFFQLLGDLVHSCYLWNNPLPNHDKLRLSGLVNLKFYYATESRVRNSPQRKSLFYL